MAQQDDNNTDGRGRVTDPESDLRVGNKSGNMGRTFAENPELASAAGRKGGEHRRAGEETNHEDELDENIRRAQGDGGGGGGSSNRDEDIDEENFDADHPTFQPKSKRGGDGGGGRTGRISQKEAVFNAVTEVLGTNEFNEPVSLRGSERMEARQKIFEQFKDGKVSFGGEMPSDKELLTYCSGLLSNWLRKDPRLNGNTRYQPKAPGSRAGAGDETLRALKALLQATDDPDARREVEEAIRQRQEELKPKKPEINVDALPEHLRRLVPDDNHQHH